MYTVENFPRGYPQLAALMTADHSLTILKRFDLLHMRNLLRMQDVLSELQKKLDLCDRAEEIQMHLSSRRYDNNETRNLLLQELATQLKAYG